MHYIPSNGNNVYTVLYLYCRSTREMLQLLLIINDITHIKWQHASVIKSPVVEKLVVEGGGLALYYKNELILVQKI